MSIENPKTTEQVETERKFHFQGIEEIESAVESLASSLKEKFDKNEYETIISDDVGGRIPTLILRKLIKKVHPENNINTYFLSAGKAIPDTGIKSEAEAFFQFLLSQAKKFQKVTLMITGSFKNI